MAHGQLRKSGLHTKTPEAKLVHDAFSWAGVATDYLSIRTSPRGVVVAEEGTDVKMPEDDFSRFMTYAHWFIDGHTSSRWATDEKKCAIFGRAHTEAVMKNGKPETPAEAGRLLADPSEIMTDEPESEFDGQYKAEDMEVYHHGGNRFTVSHTETNRSYRVDMDRNTDLAPVQAIHGGQPEPETDESQAVLQAITTQGPAYREGPQEKLEIQVGNVGGGQSSATSGSDTDDSDSGELVQDVPNDYDDYDLDSLEDELWDWMDRYADFESDFDKDIVEISPAMVKGTVGFEIDANPFQSGYHDGNDWKDKDGYDTAQEAFRGLMQDKDEIDYYGEPDYVNHIPASKVEDVV